MVDGKKTSRFYENRRFGEYEHGPSEIHLLQRTWLNELHSLPHVVVLDIGCGTGLGTGTVVRPDEVDAIIGIDLSRDALCMAKLRGIEGVQSEVDFQHLPIASHSIDVVILDEVLEHVCNTDELLDEIHRVLNSNGLLFLSTPNLAAWFNRLALLFGIQPAYSEVSYRKIYGRPGSDVVGHLRLFTKKSLLGLLRDSGFHIERVVGVEFPALPRPLRWLDRLWKKFPGFAAGLVVSATRVD